ncbi:MAG TPA: nucleotide pyrophosphohydrolase [Elainellaceae cyanobacterium]|jgi:predicted house-cleaning noncanonical NTP pyrophosphatase (MazG superfamily)
MKNTYQKLVRDRIPDIIRASGKECEIEIMADHEYQQALREKVLEEAQEVADASPDDLMKELADLYEVIDALIIAYQLDEIGVLVA